MLRATPIVKDIQFEEASGELDTKKRFPEKISHKTFETISSLHMTF